MRSRTRTGKASLSTPPGAADLRQRPQQDIVGTSSAFLVWHPMKASEGHLPGGASRDNVISGVTVRFHDNVSRASLVTKVSRGRTDGPRTIGRISEWLGRGEGAGGVCPRRGGRPLMNAPR